jgi:acyl-CoA synthetase (AMP-forming)/AMP-acid ligase II
MPTPRLLLHHRAQKELIKRGGLSVYPAEVDNALTGDARVANRGLRVPHPSLGEELVAAVVGRRRGARWRRAQAGAMEKLSSQGVSGDLCGRVDRRTKKQVLPARKHRVRRCWRLAVRHQLGARVAVARSLA